MAPAAPLQALCATNPMKQLATIGVGSGSSLTGVFASPKPTGSTIVSWNGSQKRKTRSLKVVAAVGDVSADSTTYLVAGAAAVALFGTAFPILFARKDLCPECDGAGFIRKGGAALRANAARKDQAQIVCPRCSGLGKLNQIDK